MPTPDEQVPQDQATIPDDSALRQALDQRKSEIIGADDTSLRQALADRIDTLKTQLSNPQRPVVQGLPAMGPGNQLQENIRAAQNQPTPTVYGMNPDTAVKLFHTAETVVQPFTDPFGSAEKVLPENIRPVAAVGRSINAWGDLSKGAFFDIAGGANALTTGDTSYLGNLAAATRGQQMPFEQQMRQAGGTTEVFSNVLGAMAHMAPQLLVASGLGAAGVSAPLAAAGGFGWTPEGFDPKTAAIMGAFPGVSALGKEAAMKLVSEGASQTVKDSVGLLGGFAASQGLLDLSSLPDYASMAPADAWKKWAENFAINLGMHLPAIPGIGKLDPKQAANDFETYAEQYVPKGQDSSLKVKEAIARAKADPEFRNSPEFRVLFTGVHPDIVGTTNDKVSEFARSLGLDWRAPEPLTKGNENASRQRPQPEGDISQRSPAPQGVSEVGQNRPDQTQVSSPRSPDSGSNLGVQSGPPQVTPILPKGGEVNAQENQSQASQVGQENKAIQGVGPNAVRQQEVAHPWVREEMIRRGLDPGRMFNDVDLSNPSVIQAIQSDPSLSSEQKALLLRVGSLKPPAVPAGQPVSQQPVPVPSPVQPIPAPPLGILPVSGKFGIRYSPTFKHLYSLVVGLNKVIGPDSFTGLHVDNAADQSISVKRDQGEHSVIVNPKMLHEEVKDMTRAAAMKYMAKKLGSSTTPSEQKFSPPTQVLPPTREASVAIADHATQLNGFLGTDKLPSKISVVHDPALPFAGRYENGKVVINAANTNDPAGTLMEEGLHGVLADIRSGAIDDPKLAAVFGELMARVTEEAKQRQAARRQGLDTRDHVLAEEAMIDDVLNKDPGLWARIWGAIRNWFKKMFGVTLPGTAEQRAKDAARTWLANERSGIKGDARYSFVRDATQASNAMKLARNIDTVHLEGQHMTARASDTLRLMETHGAAEASEAVKELLGFQDLLAIEQIGARSGVSSHGYRGAKASTTDPAQRAMLANIGHTSLVLEQNKLNRIQKDWDKAKEEMQKPGHARALAREAAARLKMQSAEINRDIGASIFNSAYDLASKALKEEGKTDREIAYLEGQLRGIDEASKSPEAIRQLMTEMVDMVYSNPEGAAMLSGSAPYTARDLVRIYRDIKSSTNPDAPFHDSSLINWTATVIAKSRTVRENLMAEYLASQSDIRGLMGAYQQQVLHDLETNPTGAIKRALRDQGKFTTKAERAKFAWQALHRPLMNRLAELDDMEHAASIATGVLKDPAFDSLFREVSKDAGGFGPDVFKPFLTTGSGQSVDMPSIILPDGNTVLTLNHLQMVGDQHSFETWRKSVEPGLDQLRLWLSDPGNFGHPNENYYRDAFDKLESYYMGRALLQPNDTTGITNRAFGILADAVSHGGGRLGAATKVAVYKWNSIHRQASRWNQTWTAEIAAKQRAAFKSHDMKWADYGHATVMQMIRGDMPSMPEVKLEWWTKVGNELFASNNAQSGGLRVGDRLGSGLTVTQADMDLLATQSTAGKKALEILGAKHPLRSALGGVETIRSHLAVSKYIVPRRFNFDLLPTVGAPVDALFKELHKAIQSGDENAAAAAKTKLTAVLNQNFGAIGYSMIRDRDPGHAQATSLDGVNGPFQQVADGMANGSISVHSIQDLVSELTQRSRLEPDQITDLVLYEWARMISKWYGEANTDSATNLARPSEATNSFTKGRTDTLAPYIFYKYGFQTNHDTAVHAAGVSSTAMDTLDAAIKAQISDLDRVKKEFEKALQNGVSRDEALKNNRRMVKQGETFDNWVDIGLRMIQLQNTHNALINNRSDIDTGQTLGRIVATVAGAQISGIQTTYRNLGTGPFFMGGWFRSLSASNIYTYPMAMYYAWVNATPKMAVSVGMGALKGAAAFGREAGRGLVWDPIKNVFRMVGGRAPVRPGEGSWITKAMAAMIEEIGQHSYETWKSLREMTAEGSLQTHYIPPLAKEYLNRVLGSVVNQGQITTEELHGLPKWTATPFAIFDAYFGSIFKAYAPLFGDTGINMAMNDFMRSSAGPILALERRLKTLSRILQAQGVTAADLKDRSYSHQEIFPKWGLGRLMSTPKDMADLREAFTKAGMDFDTVASQFMARIMSGDRTAQLLNPQQMADMVNAAIDYANRSSAAGTPLIFRSKGAVATLVKPFFSWKGRQFANIVNSLRWPVADKQHRAWIFISLLMAYILPQLLMSLATREYDEAAARALSTVLWNQTRSSRYFWERDTTRSQVLGAISESFGMIPFLDMAVTGMLDDLPNRASLDPSLVIVEKFKDIARYVGGVAQTGDIGYKLPELIGSILPDTKIILNRLPSQEGKREAANIVATLRRNAPTDILRAPVKAGAVNVTPFAPAIQRMENAAISGDDAAFQEAYQQALLLAQQAGKPNPAGYISQLFGARNAFSRALTTKMSPDQYAAFQAKLSPSEQADLAQYQQRFAAASQSIGAQASFVKESPASIGGGSANLTPGGMVGLTAGAGRSVSRRIGRSRRRSSGGLRSGLGGIAARRRRSRRY